MEVALYIQVGYPNMVVFRLLFVSKGTREWKCAMVAGKVEPARGYFMRHHTPMRSLLGSVCKEASAFRWISSRIS
jgi:hypothetical protein